MATRNVHFSLTQPDVATGTGSWSGTLLATPVGPAGLAVTHVDGTSIVLPEEMAITIAGGEATVPMEVNDLSVWAWWIRSQNSPILPNRYIAVVAGAGTVEFTDCPQIDLGTLSPAVEPEAAWDVALAALADEVAALGPGTGTVTSVNGVAPVSGEVTLTPGDIGAASLVGGKLPTSQLPDLAVTAYLGGVASQAAMLALSGQQGDWCTRTDLGTTWLITGADPTLLASWTQLSYPAAPVTSVNGTTGTVTVEGIVVGSASKVTAADTDLVPLVDSEASNALKKLTLANLWVWAKAKADGLYRAIGWTPALADLPAGTAIATATATRPSARSDLVCIFTNATPDGSQLTGDVWLKP